MEGNPLVEAIGGANVAILAIGLKQLMAGSRKFKLEHLARDDICALSEYASKVTGIETFDIMANRVMPGILEYWDE